MESEDEVIEALGSFAADLLTELRYEPFVRGLLVEALGSWHPVADFCVLPAPLAGLGSEFYVAALPAPGADADPAYRMIVFFCREPWFHTVATYNSAAIGRPRLALHRGSPHP